MANNQEPKILIFSTAYFPLVGGAEVAVKEITDRIKDWQFDMITAKIKPGLADFEKIGNINVYRTGFGLGFFDKLFIPVFGLIKAVKLNKQNDYIFIWSIMANQAGVAAVFFKVFSRKKLLLTLQEGDPEEHLKRYVAGIKIFYKLLIRPWHLLPFKKADYLTAISNYLKKRALSNKVKVPIKIVPNGVDINKFQIPNYKFQINSKSQIPSIKKDLNISQSEKVILTVSRLVKKNGVDDLIKAGQYLNFPFKILIAGSGEQEKELKDLIQKLNLKDKVIFLGHIDYNDLPKYYSAADVFVRASLSEGFGNVFLEALACRLPIIGTPVGGIIDFLKDRETGLFCQVNNPQDIAKKIKEVLEDDNLRKYLSDNGHNLVQQKYSWDIIASKMKRIYLKLAYEK